MAPADSPEYWCHAHGFAWAWENPQTPQGILVILRPLPLLAALAALLISGLVHGFWTQRWQTSAALDGAVARLHAVPMPAGRWRALTVEVDPEPFAQARAVGYWTRRYTREGSNDSITVILMCGRAGHMAVHTPDICYRGAGYEMVGETVRHNVAFKGGGNAQFWMAHFRQPASQDLAIYWAWSADGTWQAPSSPRLAFGGQPFLYKLYVVRETGPRDQLTPEFLQQLMPELNAALFPAGQSMP